MILTLLTVHSTRLSLNHAIFRENRLRWTEEWLNTSGGRGILANTSTVNTCRDPSIFISSLRLMIGISFYVLCCLGRCDVTPLCMVGTIDRMDRRDIYWA